MARSLVQSQLALAQVAVRQFEGLVLVTVRQMVRKFRQSTNQQNAGSMQAGCLSMIPIILVLAESTPKWEMVGKGCGHLNTEAKRSCSKVLKNLSGHCPW
jgi:hypothetical protein